MRHTFRHRPALALSAALACALLTLSGCGLSSTQAAQNAAAIDTDGQTVASLIQVIRDDLPPISFGDVRERTCKSCRGGCEEPETTTQWSANFRTAEASPEVNAQTIASITGIAQQQGYTVAKRNEYKNISGQKATETVWRKGDYEISATLREGLNDVAVVITGPCRQQEEGHRLKRLVMDSGHAAGQMDTLQTPLSSPVPVAG